MREEARIVLAAQTKQIDFWGYSLERIVQATQSDLNEMIAETIELPEETGLTVIVERRLPISCFCERRVT